MKTLKRIDPYTGKVFYTNSTIKRFANKKNQVAYHNYMMRKAKKNRAFVEEKLLHNQSVLKQLLNGKKEVMVNAEQLKNKGFYFNTITHYSNTDNEFFLCVYEYVYHRISNNQFKITKDGRNYIA
jgi:hypothetical protein